MEHVEDEGDSSSRLEEPSSWKDELMTRLMTLPSSRDEWIVAIITIIGIPLVATGSVGGFVHFWVASAWKIILTVIGVTLGIGLGLGLATHVHDRLEHLWLIHNENQNDDMNMMNTNTNTISKRSTGTSSSSFTTPRKKEPHNLNYNTAGGGAAAALGIVDTSLYASLMTSAGYDVSDGIRRGQIIKSTSDFFQNYYQFTTPQDPHAWRGPQIMKSQWPHLPPTISYEIGRFIEYLMRDFVAIWYVIIDKECPYRNEKEHRKKLREQQQQQQQQQQKQQQQHENIERDTKEHGQGESHMETTTLEKETSSSSSSLEGKQPQQHHHPSACHSGRAMVWSTGVHRPIPMMNAMYHSLAIVFGNLSSRVEHVNIFQLLLLKYTKVLSHTFKVYRQLHTSATQKLPPTSSTTTSSSSATIDTPTEQQQGDNQHKQKSPSKRSSTSELSVHGASLVQSSSVTDITSSTEDAPHLSTTTTPTNIHEATYDFPATPSDTTKDDLLPSSSFLEDSTRKDNHTNDRDTQQQQQQQQQQRPRRRRKRPHVSEMQMIKEFLLAGKLHQAITFGMDVPSLLFADADGKDCGVGQTQQNNDATATTVTTKPQKETADDVLEQRLFQTKILSECELDYNRVLSSRFVRLLLPRSEFSSPIISTLMTEMLASQIMCPIMGLFSKDYVNGWICMGIDMASGASKQKDDSAKDNNSSSSSSSGDNHNDDDQKQLPRKFGSSEVGRTNEPLAAATTTAHALDHRGSFESEVEEDEDDGFDEDIFQEEEDDDGDFDTLGESNSIGEEESIVHLLAESLVDLQNYLDFDECREARAQSYKLEIDWDDPGCQEAVRQLVLVLEAALLNGCRKHRRKITKKRVMSHDNTKHDWVASTLSNDDNNNDDDDNDDINGEYDESTNDSNIFAHHQSLSQVLMEMTSDIDTFENRVNQENKSIDYNSIDSEEEDVPEDDARGLSLGQNASSVELSTLRTLIAAWLHTGQIYHIMSILARAYESVLVPFYHPHGLLRNERIYKDFLKQLKALDGVDVLVDTTNVVSNSHLEVIKSRSRAVLRKEQERQEICIHDEVSTEKQVTATDAGETSVQDLQTDSLEITPSKMRTNDVSGVSPAQSLPSTGSGSPMFKASLTGSVLDVKDKFSRLIGENAAAGHPANPHSAELSGLGTASAVALSQRFYTGSSTPRYLDFGRNEAWAGSLRSERIRKLQSWASATAPSKERDSPEVIYRKNGIAERDILVFLDVHRLARLFYANTSLISIRNGVRRNEQSSENPLQTKEERTYISLLAVEPICPRRRIEVPDDDSSFLLRAQTRSLNPVGVHRDQRIHDLSYLCFAATYEEPASMPGDTRYRGGRFIRNCLMRYFPNGRNASISVSPDARKLDNRKHAVPDDVGNFTDREATPVLSQSFLRERYICKKWYQKGSAPRSSSILASTTMEATDFSAAPRSGKAIDFAYRMSLFEFPTVDLGGKKFTVRDSTSEGPHRTDASALEISDPALSVALIVIGNELGSSSNDNTPANTEGHVAEKARHLSNIEMGADGYPILWLKSKSKEGVVVKPYRTSYVRAALLISSTRQDAQMKCLVKCIRSGSARDATKERIEEELWPTFKLLEYASSLVPDKQSALLRDLKFGINHIDRDQLRRNGLLAPRYPTVIKSVYAVVEEAVNAKDAVGISIGGGAANSMLYKIRVVATVTLDVEEGDHSITDSYYTFPNNGSLPVDNGDKQIVFREEWVVYRSYKEFTYLHKHLKSQVSASETFAAQASARRLVDAATAAFTHGGGGTAGTVHRNRKALIPSLGQANKAGALEFTAKAIQKRQKILDGYLEHLLSPSNMLNRCPELLLFIGAFNAFPPEVQTGGRPITIAGESLGRTEMVRTVISVAKEDEFIRTVSVKGLTKDETLSSGKIEKSNISNKIANRSSSRLPGKKNAANTDVRLSSSSPPITTGADGNKANAAGSSPLKRGDSIRHKKTKIVMKPAIKAKIEKVPLGQVRNAVFELVRHQFDFDNASFFRSRMFSALKTMSFAVTSSSEFRKMLYEAHVKHVNPDALAGFVKLLLDIMWPDGAFFDSKPPLTPAESQAQADKALHKLTSIFPEQLQSVLGQDITNDGMEMLHEMLQNRLVLRSMAYMLFDLLWLEAFPELQDVLTGGSVLDMD